MQGLPDEDYSFKNPFLPFTSTKAITILIIVGFAVYFNALLNGFVWDDGFQIQNNAFVQNGQYFYYFTHTIGPYYRPLMFFFYTFLFQLFHLNSFFYHFFQVTIHIANAILIFLLFLRFFKKRILSFFLALLFLIHPMNTEPVNYIANLQDVLYVFFGLTALLLVMKRPYSKNTNIMSAVLLFLSLLSKETGILFILICSIYVTFWSEQKKIITTMYYGGTAVIYFVMRTLLVGSISFTNFNAIPQNLILTASPIDKLLTVPKLFYYYLSSLIFPNDLGGQYWYIKSVSFTDFYWPLLIDLLLFTLLLMIGIYLHKKAGKERYNYWFFFFWFCLGLLFLTPIFPLDKTASTRWFYFPMIGLLGMILSTARFKLSSQKRSFLLCIIVIFFLALSIRTITRNTNWFNSITLFSHDISTRENVADIQYNYGTALSQERNYTEASSHLEKATILSPRSFQVWYNLGLVYLNLKEFEKAKTAFSKAISLKKDFPDSYHALIYTLLIQNNAQEAKKLALYSLQIWPEDTYLWRFLGVAEYQLKNYSATEVDFQKAYQILPDSTIEYYQTQFEKKQPIILN